MTDTASHYNRDVIPPSHRSTPYDGVLNPLKFRNSTHESVLNPTQAQPNRTPIPADCQPIPTSATASESPNPDATQVYSDRSIVLFDNPAASAITIDSFRALLILKTETMTGRERERPTVVRQTTATILNQELTDIFSLINQRTGEEVEQTENRILTYTDYRGIRTPYKAGRKSYGNQTLTTVSIATHAKLLSNDYSLGISIDTLQRLHAALQHQKVLDIDYDSYTNAEVDDVDLKIDIDTLTAYGIDAETYLNELPKYLQPHLLEYTQNGRLKNRKGIMTRYNRPTNQGYEFGDRESAKPFVKFYLKPLEMLHREEPNQPAGSFLHHHLHDTNFAPNTIRVEITFSKANLTKYFPTFDKTLKSLLALQQPELITVFRQILSNHILTDRQHSVPQQQPKTLEVADRDKRLALTITGYIVMALQLGKTEAETLEYILKYNSVGRDKTADIRRLVPQIYEYQKQLLETQEYEQWLITSTTI